MLGTLRRKASDWLADQVAERLVGLAVTLDIKFRQPELYNLLVNWTDDSPDASELE